MSLGSDYYAAMVRGASNVESPSASAPYTPTPIGSFPASPQSWNVPWKPSKSPFSPLAGVGPGQCYTHNPYASTPSTSSCASLNSSHSVNTSLNTSLDAVAPPSSACSMGSLHSPIKQGQRPYGSYKSQPRPSQYGTLHGGHQYLPKHQQHSHRASPCLAGGQYAPVYATDSTGGENPMCPMSGNLEEQFLMVASCIPAAACTVRGRHLLVSVLRLQHLDKIQLIFEEIVTRINTVIMDPQGCSVIRTLLEFISDEQLETLVRYLARQTILSMATSSQYTRRALLVLFERHQSPRLDPVVEVIGADCVRIACTQQGCIGIMRICEHAMPSQRKLLMSKLIPSLPKLTTDPYGNYVAQCILQYMSSPEDIAVVCTTFEGHWVPLSCNKFASNVMEKVVWIMADSARAALLTELILAPASLQCLLQDSFGNFVLQAIIESSKDLTEYTTICDHVAPLLYTSPFGHKIEHKMKSHRFAASRPGSESSYPPSDR